MRLVGLGFDPLPGHAKDWNHCRSAWHSVIRVGLGGLDRSMCGTTVVFALSGDNGSTRSTKVPFTRIRDE